MYKGGRGKYVAVKLMDKAGDKHVKQKICGGNIYHIK